MIFLPFIYFLICGLVAAFLCIGFVTFVHESKVNGSMNFSLKSLIALPKRMKSEKDKSLKSKILVLYYSQIALIPLYLIGYYFLASSL